MPKKNIRIAIFSFLSILLGLQLTSCQNWIKKNSVPSNQVYKLTSAADQNPSQILNTNDITGAQIDESKINQIIHVDINHPAASDENSGLKQNPLKSFNAAIEKAKGYLKKGEGTKILIYPGVYREGELVIDGKALGSKAKDALLVIEGTKKGQVIFSGSEVWQPDSWKQVKDATDKFIYYEHDWQYDFGNNDGAWGKYGPKEVIAHRSEMVFLNGEPLKQVLLEKYKYTWPDQFSGKGNHKYVGFEEPQKTLKPDTFGVAELEENGNKIYVRPKEDVEFSKAKIEVGTKRFLLRFFHMENVVLRNLNFQHSSGKTAITGAAVMFGPWYGENEFRGSNILIEDCDFRWNNSKGLSLLNTKNVTLRRNTANYNGFMGIGVHVMLNTIWEDNKTSFNNWRGYSGNFIGWAIAGAKIHQTRKGIFRRHQSIGNITKGLWFDIANKNILIEDLTAIHNLDGLHLEISPGPFLVRNALLADNNRSNLLITDATNIFVENSIIHGINAGDTVQLVSSKSRKFSDKLGEILGENDGTETPIFLGATQFRNNVIVAGNSNQALIVQKTGDPKIYRDVLENKYVGLNNVYWAPQTKVFGLGFKKNRMSDINGWVDFTGETDYQWIAPQFVKPDNYDFRIQKNSPLKAREKNLPTRRLSSAKVQELRDYLVFVGYEDK
ncbi:MAG: right-handed parallel beta-helix repeat-containing protein [Calothrix sp. MO_167.B12]|nr:right-handed parallel beta-helix repeat-containing protein [Calothrix sp. MO_167.B12]